MDMYALAGQNNQIREVIIEAVSIAVVDDLTGQQGARPRACSAR